MVFAVLLLAAWQFSSLERSLNRQIQFGDAAYAKQQAALDLMANQGNVREFVRQHDARLIPLYKNLRAEQAAWRARARAQRRTTLYLTRIGFVSSLVLLASIAVWIAAFAFSMRRALFHRAEALKDPLTGLANRSGAITELQRLTQDTGGESFGVVFLDLDGFKKINDMHGHARGDVLLQGVASRLTGELREDDYVARLGGDEFVCIIAPPANPERLRAIANRLRHAVTRPYSADGEHYVIGCSVGYSLFPDDGLEAGLLLDRADRAMYSAKAAGGGVQGATPLRRAYNGA